METSDVNANPEQTVLGKYSSPKKSANYLNFSEVKFITDYKDLYHFDMNKVLDSALPSNLLQQYSPE